MTQSQSRHSNSVIAVLSIEHNKGNIFERLIGVPDQAWPIAKANIFFGTRIFIYFKEVGVAKVVEAQRAAYFDDTIVDVWCDRLPKEIYPVRIDTQLIFRARMIMSYDKLCRLGVRRDDTKVPITFNHFKHSIIPISLRDADKIEALLR